MVTTFELALHPAALVTCTEYVPAEFTVMFCVVEPFDHKYVFPAGAERLVLCPAHKAVAPMVVTIAEGGESTVTWMGAEDPEHPLLSTTVTWY